MESIHAMYTKANMQQPCLMPRLTLSDAKINLNNTYTQK